MEAYDTGNDILGKARMQHALGSTAYAQGKIFEANECYTAALRLRRAVDDSCGIAMTLHMLAVTRRRLDPARNVTAILTEAERRLREAGDTLGLAFVLSTQRNFAWERGEIDAARTLAREIQAIFHNHGRTSLAAHMQAWQSLPALAENDSAGALLCVEKASEIVADHEESQGHVFLWRLRGRVLMHQGSFEEAFNDLRFAVRRYQEMDNHEMTLAVMTDLANWHLLARGDARRSFRIWAAVDGLQPSPIPPLPLPERRWQEQYLQKAQDLVRLTESDETEESTDSVLPLEIALDLALNF
jgi:tetratricopeptide (TPR) repeat protein